MVTASVAKYFSFSLVQKSLLTTKYNLGSFKNVLFMNGATTAFIQ